MAGSGRAEVTEEERARFARQAAALAGAETDDEGTAEWREAVVGDLDRHRRAQGRPPLRPWWEGKGEIEFRARARARGLLQPVR